MRLAIQPKHFSAEQKIANIAMARTWPRYEGKEASGPVAICAAGPSLIRSIPILKALAKIMPVCAVKGVFSLLAEHGIKCRYAVFLDAKPDQARFLANPDPDIAYLIASQSPPEVFEALKGLDVRIWHGSKLAHLKEGGVLSGQNEMLVPGGITTGLRSINLMHFAGFRQFHLFGFDCCYEGANSHVYEKTANSPPFDVVIGERRFTTNQEMAPQHEQFLQHYLFIPEAPEMFVYGDGALAHSVSMLRAGAQPRDVWMQVPPGEMPAGFSVIDVEENALGMQRNHAFHQIPEAECVMNH